MPLSSWFSRNGGNKAKPSIIEDAAQSAAWMAKALNNSGYIADFTVESLRDIDRFFDEHTLGGRACQGGLLAQNLGHRLFALGAYCGEVIRRVAGGTWRSGEEGPQAEIELALVLPSGAVVYPVQRAIQRYQNGAEDSLYAYARVIVQRS